MKTTNWKGPRLATRRAAGGLLSSKPISRMHKDVANVRGIPLICLGEYKFGFTVLHINTHI